MTDGRPKPRRRWLAALTLLAALIVVVPIAGIEGFCRPAAPGAGMPAPRLPAADFTFPEWYIVDSAGDFARFLERGSESGFPYATHILGFWQSFCAVSRKGSRSTGWPTKGAIYASGIGYSAGYAIKGLYENTAGRFTEWWRGPNPTPEDIYARAVAQDYAEFLHTRPWYAFRFGERLRGLWVATPLGGPSSVRRFERKLALSTAYGVKAGSAWLMRTFDADGAQSERKPPADAREREFLASAGNRNVLITAILSAAPAEGLRELFSLPLASRPGLRRAGFDVEAGALARVVAQLERSGATVERVHDY